MTTASPPENKTNQKIWVILPVVLLAICMCLGLLAGSGGTAYLLMNKKSAQPTRRPTAFSTLPHDQDPATQTWLVMIYSDADDPVLEEDLYFDLNEAEMVGSSDRVTIIAQVDRYHGGFSGDGDWSSTRRYRLQKDDDLNTLASEMIADLGEADMNDPATLVDFVTWAISTYPADRHVLILSDHGMGWPGGWTDAQSTLDEYDYITLKELETALGEIIQKTGLHKFELIGLDACLMGMFEVYNTLSPFANYAVASEEVEPVMGFAYWYFLDRLVQRPEMSGAELGTAIVEGYISHDLRILDDSSRAALLKYVYGTSADGSIEETINLIGKTTTISAIDLNRMEEVNSRLNDFVLLLKEKDQKQVASARAYARNYYNAFGDNLPSPYIDLGNFAGMVAHNLGMADLDQAASNLAAAINQAVIAEKHGDNMEGSSGMSIHFPVSEDYWDEYIGAPFYTLITGRSASMNLWDDFLAYHYAGQEFGQGVPPVESQLPAPGRGEINIAPLTGSGGVIDREGTSILKTTISGDQIAYIYLVSLIQAGDRYFYYSMDYILGDSSQEVGGVSFPIYERVDGSIPISIKWSPRGKGVCNGELCMFALVVPESYPSQEKKGLFSPLKKALHFLFPSIFPGSKDKIETYAAFGEYLYSDSRVQCPAKMIFDVKTGKLLRILSIAETQGMGVLRYSEIIPRPGDQFIFADYWLSPDGGIDFHANRETGNVMTFGDEKIYYGIGEATTGTFEVGIMVDDMDGNRIIRTATVQVTE